MFSDYTPGMDKDRLVNLVCNRLLNNPIEDRETKIVTERQQQADFNLEDYTLHKFEGGDKNTHKPFYPYFKSRGLNLATQFAFRKDFFIAERQGTDGKVYRNLAFPMTIPGKDETIVGRVPMPVRGFGYPVLKPQNYRMPSVSSSLRVPMMLWPSTSS